MFDPAEMTRDLAEIVQPQGRLRGLPSSLYTSEQALAVERRQIFHGGWAAIGFGIDVPRRGDARPVDFLGAPLLLVRDRDRTVRVFENVCRHRGMILVEEPRNFGGVIRCPYHSWCYSLDGRLRATPHVGGPGINRHDSVDPEVTGLTEIRSAVFMDVVFVNVDGTAPAFEDWIAPVRQRLGDFVGQALHHGGPESGFKLEIAANWKLIVENNCESYHLPWVHPGLNAYSKLEDHYHLLAPGSHSGQGTLVYNPDFGGDLSFPDFPGLPSRWDRAAEYVSLYPNVFLSVHRDHFWAAHLDPLAHNRTIERVEIYYPTEEAARGAAHLELRQQNAAQWQGVLSEDVFVTEGMQKGRGAPAFDGGTFSAVMDSPTHCFHAWVADRLSD
ncbi:MAG: aromatic ring-hydroxylating dioxygenase subunit alpha [Pseudomonadota bacterium]